MATLRLFAVARQVAGTGHDVVDAATVGDVLAEATRRYGEAFAQVLPGCKVWCNGEPCTDDTPVVATDEVAVLPPVSGGT